MKEKQALGLLAPLVFIFAILGFGLLLLGLASMDFAAILIGLVCLVLMHIVRKGIENSKKN